MSADEKSPAQFLGRALFVKDNKIQLLANV